MPVTTETLKRFKTGHIFIETGCEDGNGIAAALAAGFTQVVSIELDAGSVFRVRRRFQGQPVTILHGNSVELLPLVLNELLEPATFWLDAHPCDASPILEELLILARYKLNTHTILIDDRRLMHGAWRNVTEEAVRRGLHWVNADYVVSLADGFVPNDIIVAQAPEVPDDSSE